jgi:hypothetical protein
MVLTSEKNIIATSSAELFSAVLYNALACSGMLWRALACYGVLCYAELKCLTIEIHYLTIELK